MDIDATIAGEGTKPRTISNYSTRIDGVPFVVDAAVVGVCDQCGAKYFNARESKRWRDLFVRTQTERGRILKHSDISELRDTLRLSVAEFACLVGCSRQALYDWGISPRSVLSHAWLTCF